MHIFKCSEMIQTSSLPTISGIVNSKYN